MNMQVLTGYICTQQWIPQMTCDFVVLAASLLCTCISTYIQKAICARPSKSEQSFPKQHSSFCLLLPSELELAEQLNLNVVILQFGLLKPSL